MAHQVAPQTTFQRRDDAGSESGEGKPSRSGRSLLSEVPTMAADVPGKIANLFPSPSEIPPEAELLPGGVPYPMGDRYLIDGEVRRWSGPFAEIRSPICMMHG